MKGNLVLVKYLKEGCPKKPEYISIRRAEAWVYTKTCEVIDTEVEVIRTWTPSLNDYMITIKPKGQTKCLN